MDLIPKIFKSHKSQFRQLLSSEQNPAGAMAIFLGYLLPVCFVPSSCLLRFGFGGKQIRYEQGMEQARL